MFIKLTLAKSNTPIYLSPDKIVGLLKHLDENSGGIGTKVIVLGHVDSFEVRETPEQVMGLVKKSFATKQGL